MYKQSQTQAVRHTKEIPRRKLQKAATDCVSDRDNTKKEELSNLSLIHGSTYSKKFHSDAAPKTSRTR